MSSSFPSWTSGAELKLVVLFSSWLTIVGLCQALSPLGDQCIDRARFLSIPSPPSLLPPQTTFLRGFKMYFFVVRLLARCGLWIVVLYAYFFFALCIIPSRPIHYIMSMSNPLLLEQARTPPRLTYLFSQSWPRECLVGTQSSPVGFYRNSILCISPMWRTSKTCPVIIRLLCIPCLTLTWCRKEGKEGGNCRVCLSLLT